MTNESKSFDYKIETAEKEIESIDDKIDAKNEEKKTIISKINEFNEKYNSRDIEARKNMRDLIDSDENKVEKRHDIFA